jgi:Clostripain family
MNLGPTVPSTASVARPLGQPAEGASLAPSAHAADAARAAGDLLGRAGDTFTPSATAAPAPEATRKWTVMVYSAADNSLKAFQYDDLDEMERVGSDASTAIVAQYDGGPRVGCSRYYITNDHQPGKVGSPVVGFEGHRVNMARSETLADFVTWGMQQYPAEHYALIVSSHGFGWREGCVDRSSLSMMSMPALKKGLAEAQAATGTRLDVLGFDACMMGSLEVAYELKDQAAYIVGSEAIEGDNGWPYPRILTDQALKSVQAASAKGLTVSPRELASQIVSSATSVQNDLPTLAAYDTARLPELSQAVDELGVAILNTPTHMWHLRHLALRAEKFTVYSDLYDFASRIVTSDSIHDPALKAAAAKVTQVMGNTVFAAEHSAKDAHAHGLTIDVFTSWFRYHKLDFAQDTHWDEAMHKLRTHF